MLNALRPQDYEVVQSVFKSLAHAEWFNRNAENETACAKFVLMQYGVGGLSEAQLRARCEEAAMQRFGRRH